MSDPFISAVAVAQQLAAAEPPAVLDASLVLHPPVFDGDYRRESGRAGWLDAHIPGSQHVDVASRFSDPSAALHYTHPEPQAVADELARSGIAADRAVVVYDTAGTLWAARLWYLLRWIGVDVRVLDGGLAAWRAAGLPIESGDAPAPEPVASWRATATRAAWVTLAELQERAADDPRPLVCGLAASAFDGSAPTRYTRRGRIPGSVNVPTRGLFSSDHRVRDRDQLRASYAAAGVRTDPDSDEVLLYCGGGISASANALTLARLGVEKVLIYDGSLEEWSADPSLPLDVG